MTGETSGGRQPDMAGFVIAAALIALALIIAWDAGNLGTGSTYSPAGPSAAAYAVAAGLVLLGLATAFTAWRGHLPERESFDVMPVLIILGGLGALTASIYYGGGFILGTTVMFADRFVPQDERRRAAEFGEEARAIPFLKRFTVFNIDQCEGLSDDIAASTVRLPSDQIESRRLTH